MTKLEKARKLFNANPELSKKEMIALMVSELKFPRPMAYNYFGKISEKTVAEEPVIRAKAEKPKKRTAKENKKPLHNVVNMKGESFTDDDIPAFLKK